MNIKIRKGLLVGVLPVTLLASMPAGADDSLHQKQTKTFGHAGQLVFSGATQFNLEHSSGETWFGGGSHSQEASVVGYAPVLYHPVPHFFVGLGPNVLYSWSTSANTTAEASLLSNYGIALTVGGWLPL